MNGPLKLSPALALVIVLTAACDPFGLPATRALESGVQSMLSSANSFELAGDYTADGTGWTIDMQLTRLVRSCELAIPAEGSPPCFPTPSRTWSIGSAMDVDA